MVSCFAKLCKFVARQMLWKLHWPCFRSLFLQVDLDLGNYERFLDVTLTRDNNITTGKIYQVFGRLQFKIVRQVFDSNDIFFRCMFLVKVNV